MANELDDPTTLDDLSQKFLDRQRRGERVSVSEYAELHPEFAAEIRQFFPAMLAMERFKLCSAASSGGNVDLELEPFHQLGDYRILSEIGRGGMAVVYEAEQKSLQRTVAVKVFPATTLRDTRQLQRFHREARTVARLHHNNIVPIFGVGEQDGLHYFVMQKITGISLDQLINPSDTTGHQTSGSESESLDHDDQKSSRSEDDVTVEHVQQDQKVHSNRLSVTAIAEIGVQVADALDYAHSQGVLHRDIKPSNLVLDARNAIWVTDFGLATMLEAELLAEPDDVGGTLRFMAPEHMAGKRDARSDVYSLGLTLYELLTSQPAFGEEGRNALVQKIVRGEFKSPRSICPKIPRDLEAIVLKAAATEPEQRYENAHALATDLRRFIEGRTVAARPVGYVAKVHRWARRSPLVASLAGALILLSVASFLGIGSKWRESVEQTQRAETNLAVALDSMDQILARFASSWMASPAADVSVEDGMVARDVEFQIEVSDHNAEILQDALKFYDEFAKQNPANAQLHLDTAKVHRRVADIYQRLGQYERAQNAYDRSLHFLSKETHVDDASLTIEKASTLNQLGFSYYATSRFDEAEREFQLARQLLSAKDDPESRAELARVLTNLGRCLLLMFRHQEAVECQQEALTLLETLVQQHASNASHRLSLGQAYRNTAMLARFGRGKQQQHIESRAKAIEIFDLLVDDYPNVPDFRCELSETLATGSGGRDPGDVQQRVKDLQRCIELSRALTASYPSIPRYRLALARGLREQAKIYVRTQPDGAHESLSESVPLFRSLTTEFSNVPVYRLFLAQALDDHATNLRRLDSPTEALRALQEAIIQQQAYVDQRPDSQFGRMTLGFLYRHLADTLTVLDRKDEADEATRQYEQLRPSGFRRSRR